jgi:hypothetical protein
LAEGGAPKPAMTSDRRGTPHPRPAGGHRPAWPGGRVCARRSSRFKVGETRGDRELIPKVPVGLPVHQRDPRSPGTGGQIPGLKPFAQRGNLVPECRCLSTIMPCQTQLKKLVLADHRTRRLNQRRQYVEGVAAEPYLAGRPAKIPEGRTPPSRAASKKRTTGDDCNPYFRRKSQIFGLDPASGPWSPVLRPPSSGSGRTIRFEPTSLGRERYAGHHATTQRRLLQQ